MSAPRTELVQYLLGQAGVTSLVSTRIYPQQAPQKATRPFIAVTVDGGEGSWNFTGRNRIANVYVNLDIQAATVGSAEAISTAVQGVLDGYRGTMCRLAKWLGDTDTTLAPVDGQMTGFPSMSSRYLLVVNTSAETF